MQREITRLHHLIPGDHRSVVEAGIRQCAAEHGGRLIGDPSLQLSGRFTDLVVTDPSQWWDEWTAVHVPEMWEARLTRCEVDRWKVVAIVSELREQTRGARD